MAWEDDCPILSGLGITEAQADVFFGNHAPAPTSPPEPELTRAKAVAVANIMFDGVSRNGIREAGGIVGVAQQVGLTTAQVKSLIREIEEAFNRWLETQ